MKPIDSVVKSNTYTGWIAYCICVSAGYSEVTYKFWPYSNTATKDDVIEFIYQWEPWWLGNMANCDVVFDCIPPLNVLNDTINDITNTITSYEQSKQFLTKQRIDLYPNQN